MADINVKFWGVRGTVPTPSVHQMRYGGNTSCVEVQAGGTRIILDAGTGIYQLGLAEKISDADLLLTHTHIDHIMGLPFFKPLYNDSANIRIWAGHLKPESKVETAIHSIMSAPIFPLSLSDMKASIDFKDFVAGETLESENFKKAEVTIKTFLLNHPDKATAYRIERNGKSVCYVTDVELGNEETDKNLAAFIKGTDLLIHDATYSDENFEPYKGWGHSTWQQALRLAKSAEVKKLAAFHHDPEADDQTIEKRDRQLSIMMPGSFFAREKNSVEI